MVQGVFDSLMQANDEMSRLVGRPIHDRWRYHLGLLMLALQGGGFFSSMRGIHLFKISY